MLLALTLTLASCNSQPSGETKDEGAASSGLEDHATAGKVLDPVCGMKIKPSEAAGQMRYEGKLYHFCSEDCLKKFEANPKEYIAAGGQ